MKGLFDKVKSREDFLQHEHVVDLVDTLIGRKKMKISFSMIFTDMIKNFIPCKRKFLNEQDRRRRRIFTQAQQMLNTQFDIKNMLRNSILINLMLGTMFTKQQSLLLLF